MKLKHLSESEARKIALTLRGSITKKKLDRGIKKMRTKSNSFGAPYVMFFNTQGQDDFRAIVEDFSASAGWSEKRCFTYLLHDVLTGLDFLIKDYKAKEAGKNI